VGRWPLELRRGDATEEIPAPAADPYALELEDVAAAVRGDVPPLLGREDALGQARAIAALYRSAASGAAVAV
jgi:predicted dehydrogenase